MSNSSTPTPEKSLAFFVDVLGMTESGRAGDSVYLRGWDDYERYSLKLTGAEDIWASATPPFAPAAHKRLKRRARRCATPGPGIGWVENELGHGPAFQFRDPDGHLLEIYYETEWYRAPPHLEPSLKNQAQRFPARGVNVRRIDHFNCLAADVAANRDFFQRRARLPPHRADRARRRNRGGHVAHLHQQELRLRLYARGARRQGTLPSPHLRARQPGGDPARSRHLSRERRASSRPGRTNTRCNRHSFSMSGSPAAIASRSPTPARGWCSRRTGSRSSGREAERKKGQAWGLKTIESFHTHGTPPLPGEPSIPIIPGVGA